MPFVCRNNPIVIPFIGINIPFVRNKGFTLIELIITMTVVGILAVIAVPSYQGLVESSRLTTATNDFMGDISFVRVEAMKRGASTQVGVCASSDGASCTTGSTTWASGWIIFVDADVSGTYNTGDTILKVHSQLPSSIKADTIPASTNMLIFNHMGAMATIITSLKFSDAKISSLTRTICLRGGTGRAMVANSGVSCP